MGPQTRMRLLRKLRVHRGCRACSAESLAPLHAETKLLLNKPFRVLSRFTRDGSRHGDLSSFVDVPGVYAAGRLDAESEGLLLLTSDGTLQHRLTQPSTGQAKVRRWYWTQVEGEIDDEALAWLRGSYARAHPGRTIRDLAIGDSGNDRAMLEVAQTALLVRSPVHDFPPLARSSGVIHSTACGPSGWAEGVAHWLETPPQQQQEFA